MLVYTVAAVEDQAHLSSNVGRTPEERDRPAQRRIENRLEIACGAVAWVTNEKPQVLKL
jgi:hypothetical protein